MQVSHICSSNPITCVLRAGKRAALVIPAFESHEESVDMNSSAQLADNATSLSKEAFSKVAWPCSMSPPSTGFRMFASASYVAGHSPTNYTQWCNATGTYTVQYEDG